MKAITEQIIICDYILYFAVVILALRGFYYTACILQFTMDPLVGASGEQFRFAIIVLVGKGTFAPTIFSDMAFYISFKGNRYLFDNLLAVYINSHCCVHDRGLAPLAHEETSSI